MKKITLSFVALFASMFSFCQNGNIELTIDNSSADGEIAYDLSAELWLDSVLISSKAETDCLIFENIPANIYRVEIKSAGNNILSYNYVVVEENSTTYLDIVIPSSDIVNDSDPEEFPAYIEFVVPFRFGFPILEDETYKIKREIAFGYEYNIVMPLSKHFALINTFGTGFYFYKVKDGMDITSEMNDKERFFKWTISEGLLFRVSSGNLKTAPITGWFLDVGAIYHFPLLFTYNYKIDHTRTATNRIHKYSDVSIIAKLGFAPFGLFVEYNPVNYVKSPYPPMPKLRFGVSLQVPMQ